MLETMTKATRTLQEHIQSISSKGGSVRGRTKGLAAMSEEKRRAVIEAAAAANARDPIAGHPPAPKGRWLNLRNQALSESRASLERAEQNAMDYFIYWLEKISGEQFSADSIKRHRQHLELLGYSDSGIALRMAAIKKLAAAAGVIPSQAKRPPVPRDKKHLRWRNEILSTIQTGPQRKVYEKSIDYFLWWLGSRQPSEAMLQKHQEHLMKIGYKEAYVNARIAAARSILAFV